MGHSNRRAARPVVPEAKAAHDLIPAEVAPGGVKLQVLPNAHPPNRSGRPKTPPTGVLVQMLVDPGGHEKIQQGQSVEQPRKPVVAEEAASLGKHKRGTIKTLVVLLGPHFVIVLVYSYLFARLQRKPFRFIHIVQL